MEVSDSSEDGVRGTVGSCMLLVMADGGRGLEGVELVVACARRHY